MLVPEEIRTSVAFVCFKKAQADPPKPVGTAFFAGFKDEGDKVGGAYAITARHVIEHIAEHSVDDLVLLRMNKKSGEFLYVRSPVKDWVFHPTDPSADIAVLQIGGAPSLDFSVCALSQDRIVSAETIAAEGLGIGDEVFIVGLFVSHYGTHRNIPLVRVGTIAAMPEEPVKVDWKDSAIEAYLIEARSIGGVSGSPVFVHMGPVKVKDGRVLFAQQRGGAWYLLGLVHGHFNVKVPDAVDEVIEDGLSRINVNTGLAIVVPIEKVTETLKHPLLSARREQMKKEREQENKGTPDLTSDHPDDASSTPASH